MTHVTLEKEPPQPEGQCVECALYSTHGGGGEDRGTASLCFAAAAQPCRRQPTETKGILRDWHLS